MSRRQFDSAGFVQELGRDLVRQFELARQANTPGLKGAAMERPLRMRLEQVLPHGLGVGSGCVIDSSGGTSRQMDIVLYEKAVCPVFSVNDTPEATYYPCEGVLAVGEVKSRIGKKELEDCFAKIASAKKLHRSFQPSGSLPESSRTQYGEFVGRPYGDSGSNMSFTFHRDHTNAGDIMGFIVAKETTLSHNPAAPTSFCNRYSDNVEATKNDVLCPDMAILLAGNTLTPQQSVSRGTHREDGAFPYIPTRIRPVLPHILAWGESESPFGDLIQKIWDWHQHGLTAHIPVSRYLHCAPTKQGPEAVLAPLVNVKKENVKTLDEVATPIDHLRHKRGLVRRTLKGPKPA